MDVTGPAKREALVNLFKTGKDKQTVRIIAKGVVSQR